MYIRSATLRIGKFFNCLRSTVYSLLIIFLFLLGCTQQPEGMVYIPAGEFIMGSDEVDKEARALRFGSKPWYLNERPKRKIFLEAFYIDKFEVTNREYKEFVDSAGHKPPDYWNSSTSSPQEGGLYIEGQANFPVTLVDWNDAFKYCNWKGKRLPKEAEWEKAARGVDGRKFPWGNEYDSKKANDHGAYGGPVAVGTFEAGKSPYGVYDMAGNVAEWVADWYMAYPGSDYRDEDYGERFKVVRGGGWGGVGHYNLSFFRRTSYRFYAPSHGEFNDIGFRCVK